MTTKSVLGNLEQWADDKDNRLVFNHSSGKVTLMLASKDRPHSFDLGCIKDGVFYASDRTAHHFYVRTQSLCFNHMVLTKVAEALGGIVAIVVSFNPKEDLGRLRDTLYRAKMENADKYVPPLKKGRYFFALYGSEKFEFETGKWKVDYINYEDYELQIRIRYNKLQLVEDDHHLTRLIDYAKIQRLIKKDPSHDQTDTQ